MRGEDEDGNKDDDDDNLNKDDNNGDEKKKLISKKRRKFVFSFDFKVVNLLLYHHQCRSKLFSFFFVFLLIFPFVPRTAPHSFVPLNREKKFFCLLDEING